MFSEHYKKQLEKDSEFLEKVAAEPGEVGKFMKGMIPQIAVLLGTAGMAGGFGYMAAKDRYSQHMENLKSSRDNLAPKFTHEPKAFDQRFAELSLISPTVASNPSMAHKLIENRLHAGFDLDDIHRLSAIEYHSNHAGKPQSPTAVARAQAWTQAERAIDMLGPNVYKGLELMGFKAPVQVSPSAMSRGSQPFTPEQEAYVAQRMAGVDAAAADIEKNKRAIAEQALHRFRASRGKPKEGPK